MCTSNVHSSREEQDVHNPASVVILVSVVAGLGKEEVPVRTRMSTTRSP